MKQFLIGAAMYIIGVAVGGLIVYSRMKKKQEEPVGEVITYDEIMRRKEEEGEAVPPIDIQAVENSSYAEYSRRTAAKTDTQTADIFVIEPDEFNLEYDSAYSFLYFADGVITDDEDGGVVDENGRKRLFGDIDIPSHFGEYDDDSVYIRNNFLRADMEILRSEKLYFEGDEECTDVT